MATATKYDGALALLKDLQRAERASVKASEARAALPPGSSRARVTTANARWTTAAEARDLAIDDVRKELLSVGLRRSCVFGG